MTENEAPPRAGDADEKRRKKHRKKRQKRCKKWRRRAFGSIIPISLVLWWLYPEAVPAFCNDLAIDALTETATEFPDYAPGQIAFEMKRAQRNRELLDSGSLNPVAATVMSGVIFWVVAPFIFCGESGKVAQRLNDLRERREREAEKIFRDCPHCPEMVVVPAGSFMMGSPPSEESRYDDEGPRHRVMIGSSFAVGVYEVTFEEWDTCASAGGCLGSYPASLGWGRGRRPVLGVRWDEAQSYVEWLSLETGKAYRLLSESEWEYAARAGTETRYWWGDDIGRNRANCDGCGSRWEDELSGVTAPVGSFTANAFGLHDVHGNVFEWVQDCVNDSYAGAPGDGSAWESGECSRRMVRGGAFFDNPRGVRAASRNRNVAGSRYDLVGFRVARTVNP